jgi:hypothetical protein
VFEQVPGARRNGVVPLLGQHFCLGQPRLREPLTRLKPALACRRRRSPLRLL